MFKCILIIICFFVSFETYGNESLLTLKQQLDRLQREVNDLSQSVFKDSKDKLNTEVKTPSNLTAFDLRIYDLEKDLKKLNENFEELIFQIDDLKILYEELNLNISAKLLNQNNNILEDVSNDNIISKNMTNVEDQTTNNENTLGSLVINSTDLTDVSEVKSPEIKVEEDILENKKDISSEDEFQYKGGIVSYVEFIILD